MYPLLPWKALTSVLVGTTAFAVYADDLGRWIGVEVPDHTIVRLLPVFLISLLTAIFGPTGYWAPWRIVWRRFEKLNTWIPDLNGVWVGHTESNWPTIKSGPESAQGPRQGAEQRPSQLPRQQDSIAIRIESSLLTLRIWSGLSSTNGEAHSITATPWRHQHTRRIHLSYVFKQETPNPLSTDEAKHLGAVDLVIGDDPTKADGIYWTNRAWRSGRNTAGSIVLRRISPRGNLRKSLNQYAIENQAKLEAK